MAPRPMLTSMRMHPRVLCGFLILMCGMNAVTLFVFWKEIMAGKNDFAVFYSNAQMVREGQASRMYDFEAENSFVLRNSSVTRPPNIHFPSENLIFVPLTYLPFGAAYVMWTFLSMGMLAGTVLLMRDFWRGRSSFSFTFLTILAFFPVWYCLLQGQDSILLVFFFALSFRLWRRGRDDAAGFVLAMGLFRPQLVLPFVLVAFLGWKWKFVRGFIPGAALVLLLSTWVVGFHGMADYVRVLISLGTQSSAGNLVEHWRVHPGLMPTLRGLLWMLPSWVPGNTRNLLLLSGTFGALLWASKSMRIAKDGAAFDLAFGVSLGIVTLVSFHSLLHDLSLMILPLLIAVAVVSSVRVTEKSAYTIATIAFLFFFTPLYLMLLSTDKVGLLFLPAIAALWLMSRWQTDSLLAVTSEHRGEKSISLETI